MKKFSLTLLSFFLCGVVLLHAGGGKPDSEYTSTAREDAVSREKNPANPDRTVSRFHGLGGYEVLLVEDGETKSSWVNLRWHGREVDLYDTTKESAPQDFFKKNDKIEWRGVRGSDGELKPYAIIYRIGGYKSNGQEVPSRLLVISLAGENSQVIGYGQGADEDAEAKKIADQGPQNRE